MRTSSPFPMYFRNPYILDSYTKLLLHMDGSDGSSTFTDEIGKTVTRHGDAQIDTAQSKFGGASGLFDGTGDYLSLATSADFDFSSSYFTVDCWIRFSNVGHENQTIFSGTSNHRFNVRMSDVGNHRLILSLSNNGTSWNIADVLCSKIDWVNGQWYHIALQYDGDSYYLYVNGIVDKKIFSLLYLYGDTGIFIGVHGNLDSGTHFEGWIDEFRVSKGIVRWSPAYNNFTPPTSPYPNE